MLSNVNKPGSRDPQAPSSRRGRSEKSAANQFDPWILWVTVRRCWMWAAPAGLVLAGIAAFIVIQAFVPMYRASHLLEANKDYVVFKDVTPAIDDMIATEKPLFYNSIVTGPVLADPQLRKLPSLSGPETAEANLLKNLHLVNGGTRRRLSVSYEDTDPVAAATICNAIVDSYLRQRDALDNVRVANLERWLDPEIRRWHQEVEERQRTVQKLSEQMFGYAPGEKVEQLEDASNLSLMSSLRSQISDLNVQLALDDAASAERESGNGREFVPPADEPLPLPTVVRKVPTEADVDQAIMLDPEYADAVANVSRYKSLVMEMEDSDLVRIRREHYSELKSKRDKAIADLDLIRKSALKRVMAKLEQRADAEFEREKALAQEAIVTFKQQQEETREARMEVAKAKWESEQKQQALLKQQDRKVINSRLAVLQSQYDEERARMEQFGGATAELQFAQQELDIANEVLTRLRERVAAIRTESSQDGAVRTLAKAEPPRAPVETIPTKKLSIASLGAFCVPFLIGLLWELKVQRVTDSSKMETGNTLIPVVGEIARLPSSNRNGIGRRIFEESVDSLRANLFLSADTKDARSIAVVSSMSGEGKSSVASQLALSLAKATGETVLLIDADLRYPDQHEIFGLEMGPGLSAVLAQTATLDEAINTSLGGLLHVLPAGRLDRSPHRLISQSSIHDLIDVALEKYRFVVVDTAPVLAASESLAVAASVDATLVCVMRDVSRMDSVSRSMRRLEAAGANVAGTVFSGVTASQYNYRYGSYHYALAGTSRE